MYGTARIGGHGNDVAMSRWLIFLIVLVWASGVREGPEEFACEVAIVCFVLWYWMRLRSINTEMQRKKMNTVIVTEADIQLQNELDAVIETRIRERRHRKIALISIITVLAIIVIYSIVDPQKPPQGTHCSEDDCWTADGVWLPQRPEGLPIAREVNECRHEYGGRCQWRLDK